MARIKIISSPSVNSNAGTGSTRTGDQVNFGLYTTSLISSNPSDYKQLPGSEDVRGTYPQADRDKANVEIEKGEILISPDMSSIYNAGGKKHSKGGTPIIAKEGAYIVSDYIKPTQPIMDTLSLKFDAKKDSKKTWATVLKDNIDPKYFNQLTSVLTDKAKMKDVDPYEYNSAKIQIPDFQKVISKVALGNELTKASQNKQYTIPAIAQTAIEGLKTKPITENSDPMLEAKNGGLMQFGGGNQFGSSSLFPTLSGPQINPYEGDKDWKGNASKYSSDQIKSKLQAIGYNGDGDIKKAQEWLWKHPQYGAIAQQYHKPVPGGYGMPNGNQYNDGKWGHRWDNVIDDISKQYSTPPSDPTVELPEYHSMTVKNPLIPTTIPGTNPIGFDKNEQNKQNIGYDWHNQRDVLTAMHQDPTYYPWSAKADFAQVNPQFDDPNYYPIQSANKTKQDTIAQISNPNIGRAVASYNPDIISGLVQETARSRGSNLQAQSQANMFNAQMFGQASQYDAQRQTGDYNNTIKTLDNRNTANALRRNDINRAVDHADNVRDQMKFLSSQNPQYSIQNPNNYSSDLYYLNNGKNLNDPGSQQPSDSDLVLNDYNKFKTMGMAHNEIMDLINVIHNGRKDSTKQKFIGNGNNGQAKETTKTTYQ